ncbi:MAG: hypothetical protein PHD54_07280 [Desulfuromonadaceae bacterium]|nr:hypothetical protein [Desulfuromonadaceae bacterium]
MAVNPVTTGNMASFQPQTLNSALSSDKPETGASSSKEQPSNRAAQTTPLDSIADNINISTREKQTPKKAVLENNENGTARTFGAPSHVIVTYNPQGKMRTKFLDSRSDVVYQVPPEMLAKMEDLMMKPETSTSIKG